jgi:hypothetical protein
MKHHAKGMSWFIGFANILGFVGSAEAETTLSTFDNFNLDGLFASCASATTVSGPTSYAITSSGYGSGYKAINPPIDATGETNVELTVTLSGTGGSNSPISGPIVSLVDADGTFYNYAWYGQTSGSHVLTAKLGAPSFVSAAGSVPGLDLANLAFFHLQDDPGAYAGQYTITFESLRLTGAPPPAITSQAYDPATQAFTLAWTSRAGRSYSILYTPELTTAFNPLVTGIASGGNFTTNPVSLPTANAGFLRVQEQ